MGSLDEHEPTDRAAGQSQTRRAAWSAAHGGAREGERAVEAERGGSRGRRCLVRRSEQPGGAGIWAGDPREQRTAGRARCRRAVDSAGEVALRIGGHGTARAVSLVAVRRCGLAAGVPGRPPALIALGVRSAGTCEGQQCRLRATARGRRDHGGRAHADGHARCDGERRARRPKLAKN